MMLVFKPTVRRLVLENTSAAPIFRFGNRALRAERRCPSACCTPASCDRRPRLLRSASFSAASSVSASVSGASGPLGTLPTYGPCTITVVSSTLTSPEALPPPGWVCWVTVTGLSGVPRPESGTACGRVGPVICSVGVCARAALSISTHASSTGNARHIRNGLPARTP